MTLSTAWRYHFAAAADAALEAQLDREAARAAWFAALARLELPAGAALLPHAQLVATLTARQAACDAAWVAWQGDTGELAPLEEAS